jgi:hypothetical protein
MRGNLRVNLRGVMTETEQLGVAGQGLKISVFSIMQTKIDENSRN